MARKGMKKKEMVHHPAHYGGADNPYEVIKVLEAWGLDKDFLLGNTVKYIPRAGKKGERIEDEIEDLRKARWYLDRKICNLERDLTAAAKEKPTASRATRSRRRIRAG